MNKDLQHITLKLDAHTVALNVERAKEAVYRKAATMLNQRYNDYRHLRPQASVEQLWMYVALQMAVNLNNDARENGIRAVEDKLEEMNHLIEQSLSAQ